MGSADRKPEMNNNSWRKRTQATRFCFVNRQNEGGKRKKKHSKNSKAATTKNNGESEIYLV
jgi:hypothetical protein